MPTNPRDLPEVDSDTRPSGPTMPDLDYFGTDTPEGRAGEAVIMFTKVARATWLARWREDPSTALVARKSARIVAWKMAVPFVVETDRGPMRAAAGDWLVTNHPDDDPGSDLWSISAERMAATYAAVPPAWSSGRLADAQSHIEAAIGLLRDPETGRGADRHASLAITALEDALLRLYAPSVIEDRAEDRS